MDTVASCVRVFWDENASAAYALPAAARRRLVVAGPGVTTTEVVLHRTAAGKIAPATLDFADEHLIAGSDEASPWPQVADVLIVRGTLRRQAVRRWFPGRLVAVFDGPNGEHFVEVATGWLARFAPLARADIAMWPYASFVHAWTVADRPLDALDGACLADGLPGVRRGVRISVVERSSAWPIAS
jgi:hypothetical protein